MPICRLCGINWSTMFMNHPYQISRPSPLVLRSQVLTLSGWKGILYQGGHTFITMFSLKSALSKVKTTRGRISELGLVNAFMFASCCLVICWEGFRKHRHILPFCIWKGSVLKSYFENVLANLKVKIQFLGEASQKMSRLIS